jgi:hypothetical protein
MGVSLLLRNWPGLLNVCEQVLQVSATWCFSKFDTTNTNMETMCTSDVKIKGGAVSGQFGSFVL